MADTKLSALTLGTVPTYIYGIDVSNNARRYNTPLPIHNVRNYGAALDGSTDDTTPLQNAVNAAIADGGGFIYIPPTVGGTNYLKLTAPITFPSGDHKQVFIVGSPGSTGVNGSKIIGDVADFLIKHENGVVSQCLRGLYGLFISNTNAAGGCVLVEDSQQAIIERCYVASSYIGIQCQQNAYNTQIRNTAIIGQGANTASRGILMSQVIVSECSLVGWGEAIRCDNAGTNIRGNRFEVNKIGIRVGINPAGGGSTLSGLFIGGNSFEQNDTGIQVESAAGALIGGNMITGTVSGWIGPATLIYGIRFINGFSGSALIGNIVSGQFSSAGISIEHGYSTGGEIYHGNAVSNSGAGVAYNIGLPCNKSLLANDGLTPVTTLTSGAILSPTHYQSIKFNSAGANTLSVRYDTDMNGNGGIPVTGSEYQLFNVGAGQWTISADTGPGAVTVNSIGGKNKLAQYGRAVLRKTATSEWLLSGSDLTT